MSGPQPRETSPSAESTTIPYTVDADAALPTRRGLHGQTRITGPVLKATPTKRFIAALKNAGIADRACAPYS